MSTVYFHPSTPLPPKLELTEVAEIQKRLGTYFERWEQWTRERESWLIVAFRAQAFTDLAWLYEQALKLAALRPDQAVSIRALVHDIVHLPGTTERRPEWYGNYSEENAEENGAKCHTALNVLRKRFEDLGVEW